MVTIGIVSFPTESSKEMGKLFKDIPPMPKYITRKGPYVGSEVGVGIKLISIWEYDPSKMAEVVEFIGNYYAHFIGVPGFTYTFNPFFEVKEAFKMIGLA
jgi:hypothetical protein